MVLLLDRLGVVDGVGTEGEGGESRLVPQIAVAAESGIGVTHEFPTVPVSNSLQAVNVYKNADMIVLEGQGHGFDDAGTQMAIGYLEDFFSKQTI